MTSNDLQTWLTAGEVEELTGRNRWTAQARALAAINVPFRLSAQGRPLVERSAVLSTPKPDKKASPRWDRLQRAA